MPEEEKELRTEQGVRLDNILHDVEVLSRKYDQSEGFILVVLAMLMNHDNQLPVEYTIP